MYTVLHVDPVAKSNVEVPEVHGQQLIPSAPHPEILPMAVPQDPVGGYP